MLKTQPSSMAATTTFVGLQLKKNIPTDSYIFAYVKENNFGSIKGLEKAGFIFSKKLVIAGNESVLYTKTKNNGNQ